MPYLHVDFVPARWWEAIGFIRLTFETTRSRDPWVARILARPWSLSSLLEYGYLLDNFFHSSSFFALVSGERAGVVAMHSRPKFVYMEIIGFLPRFQHGRTGIQAAEFINEYTKRHGCKWGVAAMAVKNRPVHMLSNAFHGRLMGLSTTEFTLTATDSRPSVPSELEVKRMNRSAANDAWKRWRLYEVDQVAGHDIIEVASELLEKMPRGEYLALYHEGQEIGFALARRRGSEMSVDLYPSMQFWSTPSTAKLVVAITCHLGSAVRYLKVTQTHANRLTAPDESFIFERHREEERHLVFYATI